MKQKPRVICVSHLIISFTNSPLEGSFGSLEHLETTEN